MNILIGIMLPFFGTILGASCVYLLKDKLNNRLEKFLLGFASGVMIAASIWSLLIPAIDLAKESIKISWLPASIGFLLGIAFLLTLDYLIPHLHKDSKIQEGPKANLKKTTMLILAVTLHNIPEGLAVGVVFAGLLAGNNIITLSGALALSIGIALQNFPEGAIISMPLKTEGLSKNKSFLYGVLSGIVEPIAAFLAIILASLVTPILPYFLSFAAGTMIYVVVEELIPDSHTGTHSNLSIVGVALGFVLMMILDIALW